MRGIELSLDGLQVALLIRLQQEGLARQRVLPGQAHVVCRDHQRRAHPRVAISSTQQVHRAAAEQLARPGEQRGTGALQVVHGAGEQVVRRSALTALRSTGGTRRRGRGDAINNPHAASVGSGHVVDGRRIAADGKGIAGRAGGGVGLAAASLRPAREGRLQLERLHGVQVVSAARRQVAEG